MKNEEKKPDYKKMCEVLYQSTQYALRSLKLEDIQNAEMALLMGQSTCEILYFESTFSDYDPKNYNFNKIMLEDPEFL